MGQNHLTLSFPLKSPADARAIAEQLPPLMPGLFPAEDTIGTIHYSRFTVLSQQTLLFLADYDGEFSQLVADLAKLAGPVFDAIFQHVDNPPSTPVADHADAFVEWTAEHLLHPLTVFSAYPDVTAKEIKALASAAGVSGAGELNLFLVVLPIKSRIAFMEAHLLVRARSHLTQKDLGTVGTPTSHSSCRSRTPKLVSSPRMTARSTSTLPISPNTSGRPSICYSNSSRTRRLRHAESTSRSSLTLRRVRTSLQSGSTRHIQACRFRTFMP